MSLYWPGVHDKTTELLETTKANTDSNTSCLSNKVKHFSHCKLSNTHACIHRLVQPFVLVNYTLKMRVMWFRKQILRVYWLTERHSACVVVWKAGCECWCVAIPKSHKHCWCLLFQWVRVWSTIRFVWMYTGVERVYLCPNKLKVVLLELSSSQRQLVYSTTCSQLNLTQHNIHSPHSTLAYPMRDTSHTHTVHELNQTLHA